jgi:hypothetical protein
VNGADDLETRQYSGRFNIEFENSDQFTVEANDNYELVLVPFTPIPGAIIQPGSYDFQDVTFSYNMGTQRPVSGTVSVLKGGYFGGDITTWGFSTARVTVTKRFSLEPRVSITRIELDRTYTSKLFGSRVDYGFSPRMFASALLQYNSADRTFSSNLRYRWEYRPGSEFFIVWTDEQDTRPDGIGLRNRAFVLKITRLLRF